MLEQKLTEAKSKKDTLKARAKSAQTSRQINDMIQGLNTSNAMTAFERMEEKVMSLEAESDATLQVSQNATACRHCLLQPACRTWLLLTCIGSSYSLSFAEHAAVQSSLLMCMLHK